MGIFDFLKGIIPEKLINFDISIDNRKIEITESSIKMGDEIINDPIIVDKIFQKLSEFKNEDSFPCQIIHKDIKDDYFDYENLSILNKESIELLKKILPYEEIECILMAKRVKNAYETKDIIIAKKLQEQLINRFPYNGNKIYNLIGGGYFDELILPFIDVFRFEYGNEFIEKYREFYYNIVKFFPLAFFVSNNTTEEKLKNEIIKRLNLKNIPFIRIHSIGKSNIEKVEKVSEALVLEEKFSIKNNVFSCQNGIKAQIFEIKLKTN